MKLSEYPIKAQWNRDKKLYEPEAIPDDLIEEIVFDGITAPLKQVFYALVLGTSRKIEMESRVNTAVTLYKKGYIKKIIFSGGKNGISSAKKNPTPKEIEKREHDIAYIIKDNKSEAERMKEYATQLGVPIEAIILDEYSNNTIENMKNLKTMIKENNDIILISSHYHLKRCLAIAIKYFSKEMNFIPFGATTGYFEKENYKNTELGKQIIYFEACHLVRLAREKQIEDLESNTRIRKKV